MQQLRFAAACLAIYALALLVGNLVYMRSTGDTSQFAVLRLAITVIIVVGLWAGAAWARWIGLLFAGYLAVLGWLGLFTGLATRYYEHQPYPEWLAITLVLIPAMGVSVAFLTLIRPVR